MGATPTTDTTDKSDNIALKYSRDALDDDHKKIAGQLESLLKAYPHILKTQPQDVKAVDDFYAAIKKNDFPTAQKLFNSMPDTGGVVSLLEMYPGGREIVGTFKTAKAAGQVAGATASVVGGTANLVGKTFDATILPFRMGFDFTDTVLQRMGNTISDKNAEQFATLYASASQVEQEMRRSGTPIEQAIRHPGATLSASGSSLIDLIKHLAKGLGSFLDADWLASLPLVGPLLGPILGVAGHAMESWGATASDETFQKRVDNASAGEDKKATANAIHDAAPNLDAINEAVMNGYTAAADDGSTTTVNPAANGQTVPVAPGAQHDADGNTQTPASNPVSQTGAAATAAWNAASKDFSGVYNNLSPLGKIVVGSASTTAIGFGLKKALPPLARTTAQAWNAAPGAAEAITRHASAATLETAAHVAGGKEWSESQKLAQKIYKNKALEADYKLNKKLLELKIEDLKKANPKMSDGWFGHKTELGKAHIELNKLNGKIEGLKLEDKKLMFGRIKAGLHTQYDKASRNLTALRDGDGMFQDYTDTRLNTADALLQKATVIRTNGVLAVPAPVATAAAPAMATVAAHGNVIAAPTPTTSGPLAANSNVVTPTQPTSPAAPAAGKPKVTISQTLRGAASKVAVTINNTAAQIITPGNPSGVTAMQKGATPITASNDPQMGHIDFAPDGSPLKIQPAAIPTATAPAVTSSAPNTHAPKAPIAHAANSNPAVAHVTSGGAQVHMTTATPHVAANSNVASFVPVEPDLHIKKIPGLRIAGALGGLGAPAIGAATGGLLAVANNQSAGDVGKATVNGAANSILPGVDHMLKDGVDAKAVLRNTKELFKNNEHQNTLDQWLNGAATATQNAAGACVIFGAVTSETGIGAIIGGTGAVVSEAASLGIGVVHDGLHLAGVAKSGGVVYGAIDLYHQAKDSNLAKNPQQWLEHLIPGHNKPATPQVEAHPGLAAASIEAHTRAQAMKGATPMLAHNVQHGATLHAGASVPAQTVGAKVAGVGHVPQVLQHG